MPDDVPETAETEGVPLAALSGRKVLVAWSGGLDSTHTLWTVLAKTDAEVSAHFVDWRIGDESDVRHAMERKAVLAAAEWFQENARPFRLTWATLDMRGFRWLPTIADSTIYGPQIGLAALGAQLGAGDLVLTGMNAESTPDAMVGDSIRTVYRDYIAGGPAPVATWIAPAPTRAERIAEMPKALTEASWSCRDPIVIGEHVFPCCLCGACMMIAPAWPERYAPSANVFKRAARQISASGDPVGALGVYMKWAERMRRAHDRAEAECGDVRRGRP